MDGEQHDKCSSFGTIFAQTCSKEFSKRFPNEKESVPKLRTNFTNDRQCNELRAAHLITDMFSHLSELQIAFLQNEFLQLFPKKFVGVDYFAALEKSNRIRESKFCRKRILTVGCIRSILIGILNYSHSESNTLANIKRTVPCRCTEGYVLLATIIIQLFDISYNQVRIYHTDIGYGAFLRSHERCSGVEKQAVLFGVNLQSSAKDTKYNIVEADGTVNPDSSRGFHGLPQYINSADDENAKNVCCQTDSSVTVNVYNLENGSFDITKTVHATFAYFDGVPVKNGDELLWFYTPYMPTKKRKISI